MPTRQLQRLQWPRKKDRETDEEELSSGLTGSKKSPNTSQPNARSEDPTLTEDHPSSSHGIRVTMDHRTVSRRTRAGKDPGPKGSQWVVIPRLAIFRQHDLYASATKSIRPVPQASNTNGLPNPQAPDPRAESAQGTLRGLWVTRR